MRRIAIGTLGIAAVGGLLVLGSCCPERPAVRTWDAFLETERPVRLPELDMAIPVTVRLDSGLVVTVSGHRIAADDPPVGHEQKYMQMQLRRIPEFFGDSEDMTRDSLTDARVYLNVDGMPVGVAYWPLHEGKLIRVHVDVIRAADGRRRVIVLGDYDRIASDSALFDEAKKCCETAPSVCGASPMCP